MFKIALVITVSTFLFSCDGQRKESISSLTENQRKIKIAYRGIDSMLHKPSDSIKAYMSEMEQLVKDENGDYKAMYFIGMGIYHLNLSAHLLAKKNYDEALHYLSASKTDSLLATTYIGIGNLHKNSGEYDTAINYLYKAQRIYDKKRNNRGIAMANSALGQIYQQKNDLKLAKEHLAIALNAMKDNKSHFSYMNASHTLANIYGMSGEYDKALEIDNKLLRICDSIDSPKLKAPFLDNKANCYMYSRQLDSAKIYFDKCLELDIATGNPKQIGDTYCNLGNLAMFNNDFKSAEVYVKQSIAILEGVDHNPNLLKSFGILADIYRESGQYKKALDTQIELHELYRKMMNEKREEAIAEYKIVYETGEKERTIAQNRIELLTKEREVRNRTMLLIIISLVALFTGILALLIYRQQKLKNSQQEQEHKLKTAISQIETQNKLQEQRLSISRDLHDNIGSQLTFIISSVDNIRYAFDLKNTKLERRLNSINSFTKATIVELRDTIWAMNSKEMLFENLSSRIYNFVENARHATENIDFSLDIEKDVSKIRLNSLAGMNIYRTIQEAINNAIKSAEATQITVVIKQIDKRIVIKVSDNGHGFDITQETAGNGLQNMRKRIEEINGILSVQSNLQSGTKIIVEIAIESIIYNENA